MECLHHTQNKCSIQLRVQHLKGIVGVKVKTNVVLIPVNMTCSHIWKLSFSLFTEKNTLIQCAMKWNVQAQQGLASLPVTYLRPCIRRLQDHTVRIVTCHRTEAGVTSEWGGPLWHMEDAEAWAEPAKEAIQGVLQQQGVSRVGQQMQVH